MLNPDHHSSKYDRDTAAAMATQAALGFDWAELGRRNNLDEKTAKAHVEYFRKAEAGQIDTHFLVSDAARALSPAVIPALLRLDDKDKVNAWLRMMGFLPAVEQAVEQPTRTRDLLNAAVERVSKERGK